MLADLIAARKRRPSLRVVTRRQPGQVKTFEELFREATGHPPYGYQARIARDGLPDVVQAPTGSGKTGVILAWLWRRLYGPDPAGPRAG